MSFRNAMLCIAVSISPFLFANDMACAETYPFNDTSLSADIRARDLVSRMTAEEKITQTGSKSPAIPRLGIRDFFYQNEACHGLVADGITVFPQAIGLSSTWDTILEYSIACAISDEARAYKNMDGRDLANWAPTVNMARDPRWGRNEETYGEDVFLVKKFAVNFIRGMQGNDPKYLKTIATVKHFACNNTEYNRFSTSADVNERNLREYFLPVFKASVVDANVASVMSAYNALNGVPCSGNRMLLTDILRKEWGFKGFVVSDCDAILYMDSYQHYAVTYPQAAVIGCKAGCDLNCGTVYQDYFPVALKTKLWSFSESYIDTALFRIFRSRILLGEFDPVSSVPYNSIPSSIIYCQKHQDLSLQAARESMVLLKNNGLLPLDTSGMQSVAVIGPNANTCVLGGYSGVPLTTVAPLRGIIDKIGISTGKKIQYVQGCSISGEKDQGEFDRAVTAAANADVAIMFMGTDDNYVCENRDLWNLGLPGVQEELVKAVYSANPKTVVVLVNGNPLGIKWIEDNLPAIVEAWYAGPFGGTAIAEALLGEYNPGGKLTQTWVRNESELPDFNEYDVFNNRTYMFYKKKPVYPFGYGLSFTSFEYSNLAINPAIIHPGESVTVSVDIKNAGSRTGDEVAQLYVHDVESNVKVAIKQLKGFQRIGVQPGEKKTINFTVPYDEFSYWDVMTHSFKVDDGSFDIMVGGSSEAISLSGQISVSGAPVQSFTKEALEAPDIIQTCGGRYRISFKEPGKHHVEIIRPDGRVVYSHEEHGITMLTPKIVSSGIYIVKITGGRTLQYKKFIGFKY